MKAVWLVIVVNVIVTSSYPYSHLANVRNRRRPNPRQLYESQGMLIRDSRKAEVHRPGNPLLNDQYRGRNSANQAPLRQRNDHLSLYQNTASLRDPEPSYLSHESSLQQGDLLQARFGEVPARDVGEQLPAMPVKEPATLDRAKIEEGTQSVSSEEQKKDNSQNPLPNLPEEQRTSELRNEHDSRPSETANQQPNFPDSVFSQQNEQQQPLYLGQGSLVQPSQDKQPNYLGNSQLPKANENQPLPYFGNGRFQSSEEQQGQYPAGAPLPVGQQPGYLRNGPILQPPVDRQGQFFGNPRRDAYLGNGPILSQPNNRQQGYFGNVPIFSPNQPLNYLGNSQLFPLPNEQRQPFPRNQPILQPSRGQQINYLGNNPPMPTDGDQPPYTVNNEGDNQQNSFYGRDQPNRVVNNEEQRASNEQAPILRPSSLFPNNADVFPQPPLSPYLNNDQQPSYRNQNDLPDQETSLYQQSKRNLDAELALQSDSDTNEQTNRDQQSTQNQADQLGGNDPEHENGDCDPNNCPELQNCINITQTECCPRCEVRGCKCEGYQRYDCELNGFKAGLVPEGLSYSVDMGSTICSCPNGGGMIMCSFQDPYSNSQNFPSPNSYPSNPLPVEGMNPVPAEEFPQPSGKSNPNSEGGISQVFQQPVAGANPNAEGGFPQVYPQSAAEPNSIPEGGFPQPDVVNPPNPPRLACLKPPPSCVETYTRPDGCVECLQIGCFNEEGEKLKPGDNFKRPPCTTCYCPPDGGKLFCVNQPSCDEDFYEAPSQTSQALEATQRVMRDPDGYDTRLLQPDWNNFGKEGTESSAKNNKHNSINDDTVHPIIRPLSNQGNNNNEGSQNPQPGVGGFYTNQGNFNQYYNNFGQSQNSYYNNGGFQANNQEADSQNQASPTEQDSSDDNQDAGSRTIQTDDQAVAENSDAAQFPSNYPNFPSNPQGNYPLYGMNGFNYPFNNNGQLPSANNQPSLPIANTNDASSADSASESNEGGEHQETPPKESSQVLQQYAQESLPGYRMNQPNFPLYNPGQLPSQNNQHPIPAANPQEVSPSDSTSESTDAAENQDKPVAPNEVNRVLSQYPQQAYPGYGLNQPSYYDPASYPIGSKQFGFPQFQPVGPLPIAPKSDSKPADNQKPAEDNSPDLQNESNSILSPSSPNLEGSQPVRVNQGNVYDFNQRFGGSPFSYQNYNQQNLRQNNPIPSLQGGLQTSSDQGSEQTGVSENNENSADTLQYPRFGGGYPDRFPLNPQTSFYQQQPVPDQNIASSDNENIALTGQDTSAASSTSEESKENADLTEGQDTDVEPNLAQNSQDNGAKFPLQHQQSLNNVEEINENPKQNSDSSHAVANDFSNLGNSLPNYQPNLPESDPNAFGNQPNLYGNVNYLGYGPKNLIPVNLPQQGYPAFNGLPQNQENPNFYNNPLPQPLYPNQQPQGLPNLNYLYQYQGYNGYFGPPNAGQSLPQQENALGNQTSIERNNFFTDPNIAPTSTSFAIIPTATSMLKSTINELNNYAIEHNETVSFENVLSACCYQGKQWAITHDTCAGIVVNVNAYSQICGVVQEKCCTEAKDQEQCKAGINTARSMAPCVVPPHMANQCVRNGFKTCCDCCALGLKAYSLSLSCDMEILGDPCNSAYSECCRRGRLASGDTQESAPPTIASISSSSTTTSRLVSEGVSHCSTDNNCPQLCVDTDSGIECACLEGFELDEDGKTCNDINECVLGTHECVVGQFCLNLEGSYNCQRLISCGTGYELTDKNTCNDIDECALNLHNCDDGFDCVNIRGSFRCIPKMCDEGYFTDARGGCIDIDECRAGDFSCPPRAHCENTLGSYECTCPEGLTFDKHGHLCEDVDECALGTAGCADGSSCVNTDGSYRCIDPPRRRCEAGYELNRARTACVDIDECSRGTHTCSSGSTCINDEGSFRCEDPILCTPGTRPSSDQRKCVDIDECEESQGNPCSVGGICVNTPGSYRCDCDRGYQKANSSDGKDICEDIDECHSPIGRNCQYECVNSPGSYACICPEGYRLTRFGRTCQDVDECASNLHNCTSSETCFNTQGGFRCVELSCPKNYAKLSNRRKAVMKCWDRSGRTPCVSSNCPAKVKLYTYLHIPLPSVETLQSPELVLKLRKNPYSRMFETTIINGNEAENFELVNDGSVASLRLVNTVKGPWETVLIIRATEVSRSSYALQKKMVIVYVYVSEYSF
ncbi:uncharacterized protein LOC143448237 isoform X2 [Clavelina lepadiformis]|uniref:uncharacterized protein LOC143448237 isoform X2 n=1 Tax=Clavelina lepadiformis TaxID=159417 RepID=UPI004042277E